jgi:hypothetical protein
MSSYSYTLISVSKVGPCFSSCYDKDLAIIFITDHLPGGLNKATSLQSEAISKFFVVSEISKIIW